MWRSSHFFVVLIAFLFDTVTIAHAAERLGIGHAVSPQDFAAWDIDVRADGAGLPEGRGSVAQGREIFARVCAACHGEKGEGKAVPGAVGGFDRLVGGAGTLDKASPTLTVGSYWPYATTLFDYVRRAMPFSAPQSLSNDQVYAVSAYVLYMNNILPEDGVLDAKNLPQVKMPNQDGFITQDPRPDVKSKD
ncbi:MAG: cytochrome c [Hyphomicrobiales bacterium]|nr:cytochrome c [Hyphomicrobiales bacterium]